ncbi:helix-turn-helix domain-containing protein [Streptomyces sp. H10-C2]|uniref:helix-turn-helix domain-containing protein n=1 Tax=unclassified Streptomyces TaxID=2593676 RepID=UPI0024BA6688|nr:MULTISPECIES: helix-turn-helix domain-containing protein [unclassified Streptomyces]MDJ0341635.1 helix-turn-helix domain-containing protein [Streptomyces sp. PH10-H1]MDJ0371263.1 helix-turn-helix domain-containing protein [Streptomyces sp. H10-C2]
MSLGNPPSDDRPSVGRALAQARLAAGLTIDEVSSITRVRAPIVLAIEQDDFSNCGGDVYARGHIRNLARAVGIDPEPLVQQYSDEHGGAAAHVPVVPLYEAERIRPERRRPNWTAAMVAAIVAVVGFVGFTSFNGGGGGKPATAAKPSVSATTAKPSPKPADPKPEPSNSAIAAVPAGKVTVKLTADVGKSWIQATDSNGRQFYAGNLDKGESKTFTDAKKVKLVIGDAGAIRLFVNGKDLGPAGTDGQVVRLTFTPGDPQAG